MWPKISSIARVLARECLGYENFSEGIPLPRAREVGYLYRRTPLGEIVQDIGVMYDYSEVQFHIQQWKYHRMRGVWTKLSQVWSALPSHFLHPDILTYVPSDLVRYIVRGFNPAADFADSLSSYLRIPVQRLLRKRISFSHQAHLSKSERIDHVRDIFSARSMDITGKTILLLDDVLSSGSTLAACARILMDQGAKKVQIICLARNTNSRTDTFPKVSLGER